ncbi:MAG: hypothetical protein WCF33_01365 [Pseudonocardiaceae bacterium]
MISSRRAQGQPGRGSRAQGGTEVPCARGPRPSRVNPRREKIPSGPRCERQKPRRGLCTDAKFWPLDGGTQAVGHRHGTRRALLLCRHTCRGAARIKPYIEAGATFISSFDMCAAALRPDEQEVTVRRMLEVCRLLKEPAAQAG